MPPRYDAVASQLFGFDSRRLHQFSPLKNGRLSDEFGTRTRVRMTTSRAHGELLRCVDEQPQRRRALRATREVDEVTGDAGGVRLEDGVQPPCANALDDERLERISQPEAELGHRTPPAPRR